MSIHQGYYAVIPANVRYSKDVSDGAKLLYGEITALCDKSGYCWASNPYFAGLYGKSTDTISRWISEPAKAGFIYTLVDSTAGNSRKIWLSESTPIGKNTDRVSAKKPKGYPQKYSDPIGKNAEQNTTVNTTVKTLPNGSESAPENFIPLKAEPSPIPSSAAPLSPSWTDRPNTDTPDKMRSDLQAFYENHSEDWRNLLSNAGAKYGKDQCREIVTAFCAYQIENNRTANNYRQTHAALQRWFIGQKSMKGQAAFAPGTAPAEIRYKNDKPMRY